MTLDERVTWLKLMWRNLLFGDHSKLKPPLADALRCSVALLINNHQDYDYNWDLDGLAWINLPDGQCDYGTTKNWLTLAVSPTGFKFDVFEDSNM